MHKVGIAMISSKKKKQRLVSGVAAFTVLSLVFCGAGAVMAEETSGSSAVVEEKLSESSVSTEQAAQDDA